MPCCASLFLLRSDIDLVPSTNRLSAVCGVSASVASQRKSVWSKAQASLTILLHIPCRGRSAFGGSLRGATLRRVALRPNCRVKPWS
ncbi:unnamed protein product [Amoebophrya sp. A120]|nr:unnamed protein product [Amoebophrya sp. A120]|eukprot:GSA120T00009127001.1